MATRNEVEGFLNQFKVKLEIYGVFFLDGREKNSQALLDLNITRLKRLEIIKSIEVENYSEGPIRDQLNGFSEMWVFGKDVNGQEVYIKIAMGAPNTNTICISFHKAEYPMEYPLKNKED
ncbi:MAG: toxin [Bacteroidales bacterium]|nr:toxin [Bacteroidales bacterium]